MRPSIQIRPVALFLVAAMVAIGAIAVLLPTQALSRAEATGEQDCADLYFIAAGGSGQDPGLPPEMNALAYPIIEYSSRQLRVRLISVDYAAASVQLLFGDSYAQEQYMRSMLSGAEAMKTEYEHIEALCGDTEPKYVFAGYSQGAYAVREMTDSIRMDDLGRAVFIMVGDPLRTPKETRTHTGTARPSSGILSIAIETFSEGAAKEILEPSAARTKSHCNAGDAVCATYRGLGKGVPGVIGASIKVHRAYAGDPAMVGLATWAVDTLGLADPPVSDLSITTTTLPDAYPNEPYYAQLAADGGTSPYTWSLTGGTLPPGISLSGAGVLSGTPSQGGYFEPRFTVSDRAGTLASATLPLPVVVGEIPGGEKAADISAGYHHTCAVTVDGAAKCWGQNEYFEVTDRNGGQLGDGTFANSSVPVDVVGLGAGTTQSITAGAYHSCAVTLEGAAKCWGDNQGGQLGNGTMTFSGVPVDVVGLGTGTTRQLSAGELHTCAVTLDDAAKCWGANIHGALGDGTSLDRTTPVDVVGLAAGTTKTIAAGLAHTCAVSTTSALLCWGSDGSGQLGHEASNWGQSTPVTVFGLGVGSTSSVSTGGWHTCAVTVDGAAKCWGDNNKGALGDGTVTDRDVPVDVVGLGVGTTVSISASLGSTCAVTTEGGAKCWGLNLSGGVGDGTMTDRVTPVDVIGLGAGTTTFVASGGSHACAVTTLGTAMCWGSNRAGQLGDGTLQTRSEPVEVIGLGGGDSTAQ